MKAAILTALKEKLLVDDIELPPHLEVGQVLVKLKYSGICGSQLGEIDGVKGEDKYLPHLLGHEGSGIVEEIGPGVKTVKTGDSVVLHWKKGDGIQSEPPKYKWKGQIINAGWVTTFNNYAVVSENRCTSIPKDFPKEEAALFGCAITTGFGVVENNSKLKMGESVVVFGAGAVSGLMYTTSFCPTRKLEFFKLFQLIKRLTEVLYCFAILPKYSPLFTR